MKLPSKPSFYAFVVLFLAFAAPTWAQVPNLLEYDGYLLERNRPANGTRSMEVRLYNSSTGGRIIAKENIGNVKVKDGDFYFQYGNKGIAQKLSGRNDWLAVAVGGKEQSPRFQLLSVPFALRSGDAQSLKSTIGSLVEQVNALTEELQSLRDQIEYGHDEGDHTDEEYDDGSDSDGDGFTDFEENQNGTDPYDDSSN